jgi:hypothetical protein
LIGALNRASGGVRGKADDPVTGLTDRAAGYVIGVGFGQFVTRRIVRVAGHLAFGIGQALELAGSGVSEQRFTGEAIGLLDLTAPSIEGVGRGVGLGIGAGDLVAR